MVQNVKTRRAYNGALRKEQAQMTRGRILDAARRLLVSGTYSSVTMEDIAREAGVAYQTVYGIFGSKLRLAQALIESGFPHVADALKLLDQLESSDDPELGLRTSARVSRLIYQLCADLLRFMRESGDPGLLARYLAGNTGALRKVAEFANVALYPDVTVTGPPPGKTTFQIALTNQGGGIGKVVGAWVCRI